MRRSLTLLALLASAIGCSERSSSVTGNDDVTSRSDTIVVAVNPANVGPVIPANFIGLSFETSFLPANNRWSATAFVNVLKAMGTGVLRIGGGANGGGVDKTWWTPGPRVARSDSLPVLIGADFDRVFQLCAAANWTVIFAVNFAAALPDSFAAEAAFIKARGGALLTAIELGNEPDIFAANRLKPANYNTAAYVAELNTFLDAMQRRAPGIPIAAPATMDTAWLRPAVAAYPTRIALATQHRYPTGNAANIPTNSLLYASIANLLSDTIRRDNIAWLNAVASVPRQYSVPARLAETNSAFGGGKPGVSDVFAAALWAIDHSFSTAEAGFVGINYHGDVTGGGYSAFRVEPGVSGVLTARPLLYGLLAFQDAAKGQIVKVTPTSKRRWNLSAHASVTAADGTVRLALVNKDTATLQVRISVPNATTVMVRRLTAPALSDSTSVTYAGAKVLTNGTFTPTESETITPVAGAFVVNMPFASAAVVIVTTR